MMLFVRLSMLILISVFCISCQKQTSKKYDPSLIQREKIDELFDKEVSEVLFDHLYVVVDSLTYARLTEDNLWNRMYASFDMGLPDFVPVVASSSTCYMRGHLHYLEILGPTNTYNEPVGKSGIGFSLKNDGEHFHRGISPKMRGNNGSIINAAEIVSIPLGVNEQIWFKAFYTPSPGTALHTWYAFYNPVFLDSLNDQKHTFYSREAFLQKSYREDFLFNGINSIHLKCTPEDYHRIAQEMRHLGCRLLENNAEKLTIQSGDVFVTLTLSNVKYSRITRLQCRLNRIDNSVTRLGNLTITNSGKESVWDFSNVHSAIE
ncbi:MAG: DUF5829 family protein [Bacteroidota bacterium]